MAIVGIFTNNGISKSIEAQNNEGFSIFVETFGVSRISGALDPATVSPNSGMWYQAPISTRVKIDNNTVKIVCSIPSGIGAVKEDIKEIYLFGKDSSNVDFLLAFGQPTETIKYDPTGTTTFELQISLVDIDLTKNYVFQNTQSNELDEHKTDPNAHPEISLALKKAGIFLPMGAYPFMYAGQNFDEYADFAGTKAIVTFGGITFVAKRNGNEINGAVLTFDNIKTIDEVVSLFNEAHPNNTIEHNGVGDEVLSGTASLSGGSYLVEDGDLVYRDVDNLYKQAIADGTIKSKVAGRAYLSDGMVKNSGLISWNTGFSVGDDLYLSDLVAGKITNISTSVKVGYQLANSFIVLGSIGGSGGGGGSVDAGFDAVVSDDNGFKQYKTLQSAIRNVPNNGFILVKKIDELKTVVRSYGKVVNVVFRGYSSGLKRFLGQNHIQKIAFSQVPTAGTWRLEYKDLYSGLIQFTNDLPYNASASAIQAELNALNGHSGCVVSGDYVNGFTITFNDKISLPLITVSDVGQNEIQRFDFSQIPDDGTCDFQFDGFTGTNHAYNDTPAMLESLLEALPSIADIAVRGSLEERYYELEFVGADSLRNKTTMSIVNSNLNVGGSGGTGGVIVEVNGSSTFPAQAVVVQEGRFPANNLKNNLSPISITVTHEQEGSPMGPAKAIEVDADACQFVGMGKISDFNVGINMSSYLKTRIELNFDDIELPIDGKNQIVGKEFNFDGSIGVSIDAFNAKSRWEVPVGTIDGINNVFTLNYTPNFNKEAIVTRNGISLPSSWWTIVGNVLTITNPSGIPAIAQYLEVKYTPNILAFTPDISYYPWNKATVLGIHNQLNITIPFSYKEGSSRLAVYRNGARMLNTENCGEAIDQYQETSETSVSVSLHQQIDDEYDFVNLDYRVLSSGEIFAKSGVSVLTIPAYTLGNNSLRIWRNGILMNTSGKGDAVDRYNETTTTTITLDEQLSLSDVLYYEITEFVGTREDLDGMSGTSIGVTHSMVSGKVDVFKNGIHLTDYTVTGNFSLELGQSLLTTDVLTVIVNNA